MDDIAYICLGKDSSGSDVSPVLTCNRSDHPLDKIAYTPLRTIASMTHCVIALGSDTTMLPKPIYTNFFPKLCAVSINSTRSSGGVHFLALTSASSRNQYPMQRLEWVNNDLNCYEPVMRIHSGQSNGGGTTCELKLYKMGSCGVPFCRGLCCRAATHSCAIG